MECRVKSFADTTKLPFTTLRFFHEMNGFTITHRAVARGLLAPLLYLTLRRKLKKEMPIALKALATL